MPDWSRTGTTTAAHPTVRPQGGGNDCATGVKTTFRLPKEGTTIGTWNIRSLQAYGRVQALIHVLNAVDGTSWSLPRFWRNYHR